MPNFNNQTKFFGNTNKQRRLEPARIFTVARNQRKDISYLFCNDSHLAGNCKKIKFLGERMKLLSDQNNVLFV